MFPSDSFTIFTHANLTTKDQQLHLCWGANLGLLKPTLSTCLGKLKGVGINVPQVMALNLVTYCIEVEKLRLFNPLLE